MATTPVIQDGDDVSAAEVNQFVGTPGKTGVLPAYGRVYYNGSIWQVDSTHDSYGLSSPTFSSNKLNLTLSNLAAAPVFVAVQNLSASTVYIIRVHTTSATVLQIEFRTTAGVLVTTPDTSMDVYIIGLGA